MGQSISTALSRLDHEAIGLRLKTLRQERGYSQAQVAAWFGLAQNSISNLEKGQTHLSLELAVIIAEAFEVTVDDLVVVR